MTPQQFEQEVRRIARYRWPSAEHTGPDMFKNRERDGIFITEDCVHLVECTMRREKEKTLYDLQKLFDASKEFRTSHSDRAVKCWFVTHLEPTADQCACRKEIKGAPEGLFNILSFAQFQAKLIDVYDYLQLRDRHKFGSIYDPKSSSTVGEVKYVEVGLRVNGDIEVRSAEFVANSALTGDRFTLLGEYGIGKSMTLRQIYRHLADAHRKGKTHKFPLYLNLREHQGQPDPAEIIERHARNIGFANPSQLVRAWKAGYVVLLLDGFDEVSSQGMQGAWRRLKDARSASVAGVRKLIQDSPSDTGMAIAGREHFFDGESERRRALGQNETWKDIRLDEFTDEQIAELVKHFGFQGKIPSWVPSRPLLLSTLLARGFGAPTGGGLEDVEDPAAGWSLLLDEVCSREARIESGVQAENVRAILENLASIARCKEGGVGPISTDEILSAFHSECGFSPTDEALIVLQRLPGLGRDASGGDDSRSFVDIEFADACGAGDFARYCQDPFAPAFAAKLEKTRKPLGYTGISVASFKLASGDFGEGKLTATIRAIGRAPIGGLGATSIDVIQLAGKLGLPINDAIQVSGLMIDHFEISSGAGSLAKVTFSDCHFDSVDLGQDLSDSMYPQFRECIIRELEGRISDGDLPKTAFVGCVIEKFMSSASTTNATMNLSIPQGAKVLVTILRKLFVKSLGGRKDNGLYRGLDPSFHHLVPKILAILQANFLVTKSDRAGEPIWIPVRRNRRRAMEIISSPSSSKDPVIVECRSL